jgi:hypothetical protein
LIVNNASPCVIMMVKKICEICDQSILLLMNFVKGKITGDILDTSPGSSYIFAYKKWILIPSLNHQRHSEGVK